MFIIHAILATSSHAPGVLWAYLDTQPKVTLFGPVRCWAWGTTPGEDDHPAGEYTVKGVARFTEQHPYRKLFGPAFIGLDPVSGDAFTAKLVGRDGIGLHGGPRFDHANVPTRYGSLRLDPEHIEILATHIETATIGNTQYVCEVKDLAERESEHGH